MNSKESGQLGRNGGLPGNIGKYSVTGLLGQGARGIVYKGRDPQIRRDVAIKTLVGLDARTGEDTLNELLAEARLAGNLRHPNIVTIFELNSKSSPPFLVMDYVEGESLEALLLRERKLEPSLALHILTQIASGLDYSHRSGVIHKDLKPANVVIDKYGDAFILDFGIAAFFEILDRPVTQTESKSPAFGTPGYMSPEQILNNALDHRSDLFSFAVIAFECLTGKSPFLGRDVKEIAESIFQQKQPAISKIAPELSHFLDDIFSRAFSIDRGLRYGTAGELVERLATELNVDTNRVHSKYRISLEVKTEAGQDPFEKSSTHAEKRRFTKPDRRQTIPAPSKPFSHPFAPAIRKNGPFNDYCLTGQASAPKRPGAIFEGAEVNTAYRQSSKKKVSAPFKRSQRSIHFSALCASVFFMTISGAIFFSSSYIASADEKSDLSYLSSVQIAAVAPSEFLAVSELSNSQLMRLLVDGEIDKKRKMDAILEVRGRKIAELVDIAPSLLTHESSELRQETILALTELGDRNAVPTIMHLLSDDSANVRREAAAALASLADRRSRGYLSARLEREQNPYVKEQLQLAINRIDGF